MSTKAAFGGATITVSALSIIGGAVAMDCPTNSVIGPFARLVDPFSPLLFAIGLLFALFALLLGARRLGPLLALVAIGCGGWLYSEYRTISQPLHPEAATDVRILWFNVLASNSESADRIVDAALAEQPDILVFTEAGALTSTLDRLRASYDFVSPCEKGCTMLVATNLKVVRTWAMRIAPGFPKRYMVLEYATQSGKRGFLVANHLAKPWMSGIAETEIARLKSQYDWLTGPVAVVGDYNDGGALVHGRLVTDLFLPVEIRYEVRGALQANEEVPAFTTSLPFVPRRLARRFFAVTDTGAELFGGEAGDGCVTALAAGESILAE